VTIVDNRSAIATKRRTQDEDESATAGGGRADRSDDARRLTARFAWFRAQASERLWPTVTLFFVLASAATLTSSWGYYVGDNRFEQYWNPARRIAKSLTIWDGSRGLGRVREDFWPSTTLPIAILRGLGFSPSIAEHLFHAACITMAAVGMVLVVRLFRPRIGMEHLIAGFVMGFGSFSATFLLPSNLYYHYALAPWLFVVVFRGVHSDRPWRWAAMFALLAFSPGNVDTPGLIYNCVPLISVVLFLVFIERSVRLRDTIGWFARAFVLSVFVNAVVLAKTVFAAAALGQRLSDTEAADIAALTSSWPESMRGLGNWLSYYAEGSSLLKPQGEQYFTNWIVVVFTFIPPCVALFVLWQSRWRVRLLYLMTMLSSLVILVGAFPRSNSSPLGKQILNAYTNIKVLAAFRNTYKIGAGLVMGVAALFAYGVLLAFRSARRRNPKLRFIPIALAFLTISVVAYPFWTGNLYDPTKRMKELPTYWAETFDFLNAMPTDGRSLVLPQTSRTRYRWGWVGDDLFDALDARNHALVTGVPLSTPIAGNALEALTLVASDAHYEPGVFGAIARRLGITEVVLRNDIDWQDMTRPRPYAYEALRHDPDFERIAAFGAPGENTVKDGDIGPAADVERTLPPVEIYALKGATGGLRTTGPAPPMLLSGDAFSWPSLVRAGMLNGDNPIAYTAELTVDQLLDDLDKGAPVVITDSNRRRLRVLLSYEPDYSYLLSEGQDLDRPAQSIWPKTPGSQSVAYYPDAKSVVMSGAPRSVGGTQLWNRPANAFDRDFNTSWLIRRLDRPFERTFRIELRHTTAIGKVSITLPANTPTGGGISKGTLRFSDGNSVPIDLSRGLTTEQEITGGPVRTDWIEFTPTEVGDASQTLGIAEMSFPGADPVVDLTEYVQSPDDLLRNADTSPELRDALEEAPTAYVFTRNLTTTSQTPPLTVLSGATSTDEETNLRRRFRTVGDHSFDLTGTLRLRSDTPDKLVDQLIGGDHGGFGSDPPDASVTTGRRGDPKAGYGGNAMDGNLDTSWLSPARTGQYLTVRFPKQLVTGVSVTSKSDGVSSKISTVSIEATGPESGSPDDADTVTTQTAGVEDLDGDGNIDDNLKSNDKAACEGLVLNPDTDCRRVGSISLPQAVYTDHLTIKIEKLVDDDNPLSRSRIDEVNINGVENEPLFDEGDVSAECRDISLQIEEADGEPENQKIQVAGSISDVLAGHSVPISGCERINLANGWHRIDSGPNSPLDQLQLLTPNLTNSVRLAKQTAGPELVLKGISSTQLQMSTTNSVKGTILLFDQSYDPGWRAFVNGQPIGPPRDYNALNGWVIETTGPIEIELRYNPQRAFGYSVVVTILGLIVCGYLIAHTPRRLKRARAEAASTKSGGSRARSPGGRDG